ncbi:MAG: ribbon-helix-helix domain-containing protein [Candidatus Krumholzibacteria bacterium]|nr:ribbon-helix-helix domain-containing protein [Candidatus Krumholzibacteria bacterium]
MKVAISLPDDLFAAAERVAERLGLSRSALFQEAVRAFLHAHGDKGVTEVLDEVYREGAPPARLDAVLEQMQAYTVGEEDEW